MKKTLALILAALSALTLLGGCGGTTGASSETTQAERAGETSAGESAAPTESAAEGQVKLTFWSPTWHKDADEQVIADFEKLNPDIDIEPSYYSSDDIKTNLKIAASSGTMPDMWYMWGGFNFANYYAKVGMSYDLSAYAAEQAWTSKYIPSALELCAYEGKTIALPQVYTGLVMWYRTDIFEQYGLQVPKTMEELEAVCATLKENGVTPFSTGSKHIYRYTEALLEYYAGAEEHDALNALSGDWGKSAAVAQALAKIKEWGDKGYFQDGYVTEDSANTKMFVFNGQAAMVMDNSGMASDIVANDYEGSQYGFFAFPNGKDGKPGRVSAYVKVTQFNKDLSEEKFAAAMKFWDYYYSAESLAAHQSIEQPTAIIGAQLSEKMQLADGLLELIDQSGSYTTTDLDVPSEVMDVIFSSEESVLLGDLAPEDFGAAVQDAVEAYKAANP